MLFNSNNFYPTKKTTAYKLFSMFYEADKKKFFNCVHLLEPSAGKGDLIESFYDFLTDKEVKIYEDINSKQTDIRKQVYYNREKIYQDKLKKYKIDAIEIDGTLRNILIGKNINVVASDFLNFNPPKFYDLIIANFPFSEGVHHALKAIGIQERMGGSILCIINAETLKNPYSKERKILVEKLKSYKAKIEFLENEFLDAERKTDVEIAMIYVNIPMKNNEEGLFNNEFSKLNEEKINIENMQEVAKKMNTLERLCFEFNVCRKNVIELYEKKARIEKTFKGLGIDTEIGIVNNSKYTSNGHTLDVNEFISKINLKYWNKLIEETDLRNKLPSSLKDTFNYGIERQKDIEFNYDNVKYFYYGLLEAIPENYSKCVADIFKKCTYEHCYTNSIWNKNIYMYTGWKTNCAYMIKGKCIIPFYNDGYLYEIPALLQDLNVVFNNISGLKYNINTKDILEKIKNNEKNIDTGHFLLDVYKKGTIHIKFKNEDHLRIFNVLAGKGSNALPPDFGKKKYNSMNYQEKQWCKDFGFTPEKYDNYVLKENNYLELN